MILNRHTHAAALNAWCELRDVAAALLMCLLYGLVLAGLWIAIGGLYIFGLVALLCDRIEAEWCIWRGTSVDVP